ncbi:MAG: type IV secretion system protein TraC [Holosporales bacterium]
MNIIEKIVNFVEMGVPHQSESAYQKACHSLLQKVGLGSFLPYLAYDDEDEIYINRDSIGFVLEATPIVGAGQELEEVIASIFQDILPLGSSFQVLLWASPKIAPILDYWEAHRIGRGDIYANLARQRNQFLANKVWPTHSQEPARLRNFRILLSYSEPGGNYDKERKIRIKSLINQIKTTLEGGKLYSINANPEKLLGFLSEIVNFNTSITPEQTTWFEETPLSSQVAESSNRIAVMKDRLAYGDGNLEARLFDVSQYPKAWYLGAMSELIGSLRDNFKQIPSSFFIHYGAHICDDRRLDARMDMKSRNIENQAKTPFANWIPSLVREAQETRYVIEERSLGARYLKVRYQIGLMAPAEDMDLAEQHLLDLYRANGWRLMRTKYHVLPSFLGVLPMTWGSGGALSSVYFDAAKTTLSTEPAKVWPVVAEWKGTSTPGTLLTGRRGQLFYWYPFDNDQGNYNVCVVGKSGSGKSVFMQEMMTSVLGLGGQVFVLDVGRSFKRTSEILNGAYIEFSPHSNLILNPFEAVPEREGSDEALGMLSCILSLMAAPKEGTTDIENAIIQKALIEVWRAKGQKSEVTDVVEILKEDDDLISQRLAKMLFPYTRSGIFGRFFHGKSTIDLSSDIMVFEFEELKEQKDLQAVILQILILQITNRVYLGDRKRETALFLDEAWDLLRNGQSGFFIETAARRFRKYKASLVTGTQGVDDFYRGEAAKAAFDNSDWLCLLSQKKESVEQLRESKRVMLDEPGVASLIQSLHKKKGEYAEIAISGPPGVTVGRLRLDPFSRILYSTNPEEYAAVEGLVKQGLSLSEAIRKVAAC